MSGICGVVTRDPAYRATASGADLAPMLEALGGRPAAADFAVAAGPARMGARAFPGRLAGVAELTARGRPMALAFHGSLYNLKDVCALADDPNDPYAAIVGLYLKEGVDFLDRLRGDFALALWDGRSDTLHLATDRFRVHPLFYAVAGDGLAFASRLQSVLAGPLRLPRTIDPRAIVDVVASSVIPTPRTIFREVQKLPPGHLLRYRRGTVQVSPYWELSFLRPEPGRPAALAQRVRAQLSEAIAVRLREEPGDDIGTFLSGGIDSSTVTGVLGGLTGRRVKSFSIGFREQSFNELHYARTAARAFRVEHHEYVVTPRDTREAIPVLLAAFDEPFANASAIATYFCATLARRHGVSILYAGDGGDELFAGNSRYAAQRVFDYYHRLPAWLRTRLVEPLTSALAGAVPWPVFTRATRYIRRANIPYPERLYSYGLFTELPLDGLLDDELLEALGPDYDPYEPIRIHYSQAAARDELDRQLSIDLKLAISDNDLFKVTRMAEAAGVTVRFPFLDHPLAELAASIPANLKMRGTRLRSFFKQAYADLLPPEIRAKKKHGFGLPIPILLRTDGPLRDMMQDLLLGARSRQRGYFRPAAVQQLVDRHATDTTSFYGTALWNLMVLELWHRKYAG